MTNTPIALASFNSRDEICASGKLLECAITPISEIMRDLRDHAGNDDSHIEIVIEWAKSLESRDFLTQAESLIAAQIAYFG